MNTREDNGLIERIGDQYASYLKDESRLSGKAEEISFPAGAAQVQRVLCHMEERRVPVTVQGGRTGITGAAIPARGGHILNMSRMRSITGLRVDDRGFFYVTAEPGVQLSDLSEALIRKSFDMSGWDEESSDACERLRQAPSQFFPPDPTETTATLGGMFACNAQGLCAYRYGSMADHVERITVELAGGHSWRIIRGQYLFDENGITLPDGRRMNVDMNYAHPVCRCLTPYPGMDLIELFAGSEGMLGVVTSLTLHLLPAPAENWAIIFFFQRFSESLVFIKRLVSPQDDGYLADITAVELFDRASLDLVDELKAHMTKLRAIPDISPLHQASVYVQLSAGSAEAMEATLLALLEVFCECGGNEDATWAAAGEDEMRKFKLFRHAVPEAANVRIDNIRQTCPEVYKTAADFSFPPECLEQVVGMYQEGIRGSGMPGVIFGHAVTGRFHVNLFPRTSREFRTAWDVLDGWAARIIAMGGRLADENGVGKIKRDLLLRHMPDSQLQTAKAVKSFFDPSGLLNPGNML